MIKKYKELLYALNIIMGSYFLLFTTSILSLILFSDFLVETTHGRLEKYLMLYTQIAIPMLVSLIIFPLIVEIKFLKTSYEQLGILPRKVKSKTTIVIYFISLIFYSTLVFFNKEPINIFLLSIYIFIQCFGEEILFRGVLQRRLHLFCKPYIAIIVCTVIFVFFFHEDTLLNNLLYRTPISLILSFTFYKTKNILPCTFIHFLYNLYYSI